MELNEFKDPDSCKIFKLVVDFLYEKNLTQFIENKNEYKPSDFCLKKFTKMLDKNNETGKKNISVSNSLSPIIKFVLLQMMIF